MQTAKRAAFFLGIYAVVDYEEVRYGLPFFDTYLSLYSYNQ